MNRPEEHETLILKSKKLYGDAAPYMIRSTIRELFQCAWNLRAAISSKDQQMARSLMHQMIGICGFIGNRILCNELKVLQKQIQQFRFEMAQFGFVFEQMTQLQKVIKKGLHNEPKSLIIYADNSNNSKVAHEYLDSLPFIGQILLVHKTKTLIDKIPQHHPQFLVLIIEKETPIIDRLIHDINSSYLGTSVIIADPRDANWINKLTKEIRNDTTMTRLPQT